MKPGNSAPRLSNSTNALIFSK
uniref:Uncharacterized protein n=1 Tax=Arundo donax TaxID=35708 RepID=A0A0A8ZLG6_ARUDO